MRKQGRDMTQEDEQIQDSQLDSNLRKATARRDKAHAAVRDAQNAHNANTRHGERAVRQAERAARKADESLSRHTRESLTRVANEAAADRSVQSGHPRGPI